jgi:transketolase
MKEYINQGSIDTRSGFGAGLLEAGKMNENVVALCADLVGSLKMADFIAAFPDRFFQCGIAEANMVGVAAGMALSGKIPFIGSFANFVTARVFDQVRQSIVYSKCNVKIAASHAGVTLGEDGATHQTLEDIGMMRMLPGMVVISPCDFNQTKAATIAAAEYDGPVYLRFGRPKWPNFTPADKKFTIGKAEVLEKGSDVTIIATGHMVWQSILAAQELEKEGVSVELIDISTIKPLDEECILESVGKTRCCVVAEEHEMYGGLGEMVAGLLARRNPAPMEQIAVFDKFGQSGTPDQLLTAYGLDAPHIAEAARKAMKRR